jgi:hypothetical protein
LAVFQDASDHHTKIDIKTPTGRDPEGCVERAGGCVARGLRIDPFDALSLAHGKPSDANKRIHVTWKRVDALSKRQRVEWVRKALSSRLADGPF